MTGHRRFPNASQDAVFPTETSKGDATGPAPGVASVSAHRRENDGVTVKQLLKAERTLEGEALVVVQLAYLNATSGAAWPGSFHDEGECDVCDSRREAMRRWLA